MGNKRNLLASVAIVEGPQQSPEFHYLVVVQSRVLRVNSAVAHQTLALRIHRLIESLHANRDQNESITPSSTTIKSSNSLEPALF